MTEASAFMRVALEAALGVRGRTSPNPWVGAVIVRNGEITATGATEPPPGRHAEAVALANAPHATGADVYVTLEPCAPFPGKRTPPCSQALIDAGVRRVFVALEDPHPGVAGSGIAALRAAGVQVEVGDGARQARELLRPYLTHRLTGMPHVIAKFAASLDGKIATANGDSRWITGPEARDLGHQQRAWVDAIIAGSETVLRDDPALTARPGGELSEHQPVRVILDSRGRISPGAKVLNGPGRALVATTPAAQASWRAAIERTGAGIILCEAAERGLNLNQLLRVLAESGIVSAWVEGGAALLGSLFDERLVDEVWAFIAPMILGGTALPAVGGEGVAWVADAWRLRNPAVQQAGQDVLIRGLLREAGSQR